MKQFTVRDDGQTTEQLCGENASDAEQPRNFCSRSGDVS